MTTLFDATRPVNRFRPFGSGILPYVPHRYDATHSAADETWLVQDNAERKEFDREVDRMAQESEWMRRIEAGLA